MALEFLSSCGAHLTTAQKSGVGKWDVFQDSVVNPTGGIDGGACFDAGLSTYTRVRCVKKVTLDPLNEVIFGWRHYLNTTLPLAGFGWYVIAAIHYGAGGSYSGGTKQLSLNMDDTGHLYLARGDFNGTVLGTATTPLSSLTWKFIEVKAVIHSTLGSVTVNVDDEEYIALNNINTQGLGSSSIDAVEFIPWSVDDVYILSTTTRTGNPYIDFFGKRFRVIPNRMQSIVSAEWLPPVGMTNLEAINDSTPDGSSNAGSAGDTDLFVPTPLPASVSTVLAVQSNITASATGGAIADVTKIDSVSYEGPSMALTTSETDHLTVLASTPDDNTAWTRDKYNAAKRGYRRTS